MESFLLNPVFRDFVFPLIGILFRIFVKRVQDPPPTKREHFDVGLDVMCDALLMFVGLTFERAVEWTRTTESLRGIVSPTEAAQLMAHSYTLMHQLVWAGGSISTIFFLLMFLTWIKRDYGKRADGSPTAFMGIIVPVLAGFLSLAWVARYFSN